MRYPSERFAQKVARTATMAWKKTKRLFKNKEAVDLYTRTVKILNERTNEYMELKMKLDTGCEEHNLITEQILHQYELWAFASLSSHSILTCLDGNDLVSLGTIQLRWKCEGFRKIFRTTFHIIGGDILPWEVLLGARTIQDHGILKFAGFGGKAIMPKFKEEKSKKEDRKKEHNKQVKSNEAQVAADIRANEEAARAGRDKRDGNHESAGSSRQ